MYLSVGFVEFMQTLYEKVGFLFFFPLQFKYFSFA